jgi:hypothetical protein
VEKPESFETAICGNRGASQAGGQITAKKDIQ